MKAFKDADTQPTAAQLAELSGLSADQCQLILDSLIGGATRQEEAQPKRRSRKKPDTTLSTEDAVPEGDKKKQKRERKPKEPPAEKPTKSAKAAAKSSASGRATKSVCAPELNKLNESEKQSAGSNVKDCFPNIVYFALVSGDLQDQLLRGKLAS